AVVARQGEATLEAPELDVIYAGRAAIGPEAAKGPDGGPGSAPTVSPADGAQATPPEPTRLKWLRARGGVTMISKGDRAESETLDYNADDEQIALAGAVKLTQLPERIVVADHALLDQKADTALLTGNVVITQGRNVLRGGRMMIDRKVGTAKLASPATPGSGAGRIATTFYQAPTNKPAASAAATRGGAPASESPFGALGASFKSDPNSPIEVEAATLDVNDRKHTAIYSGAVVAKQGTFVVKTDEMTAHYAGDTGLAVSAAAAPATKAGGPGGSELRRIEARKNVIVTGAEGEQATGDWATFDVKANTIVMGGNVTVAQGKQLVRANEGRRLVIDLGTGVTHFEADPGAMPSKAGPQVSGAFATSVAPSPQSSGQQPSGCPPGAVCK
ncbi:MAG: LptA/OstA family protein, partial [Hyphomicrobium sp.]|nr:LptA/OstA family protein [Hyphomicrobium sp.]